MNHGKTMHPPLLLRVSEAAELLGIGRSMAYDLCARGKLPTVRLGAGRAIRIPLKWLEAYIDELTREAAEEMGLHVYWAGSGNTQGAQT